jgi:FkbM family methyltransferase
LLKNLISKTRLILQLAEDLHSVPALCTWPKFSVTSYFMISGLNKQGIKPGTVLDVGANAGQFAIACAKLYPNVRIHSFEPVPECFEELQKNISGFGKVVVYPLALGESEGEISFRINAHSQSSSALPLARAHRETFPEARETRKITAEVSTLDRVFADVELRRPVLLKLDVQGYEVQVLRGGVETLRRVDYVVLEASFKPMYEGEPLFMDVVRWMEGRGFRFERPVGWLAAPRSGEILQLDALFVRAV